MKRIAVVLGLAIATTGFAQEKETIDRNVEVTKETKTMKVKVNNDDARKMKVTAESKTPVMLSNDDKNQINQSRVEAPSKVTVSTATDVDGDSWYDKMTSSTFYTFNEQKYLLTKNDYGFKMTAEGQDDMKVYKTNQNNYYIFESDNRNGVGYFDANGNFIVEYYDYDETEVKKETYMPNM
ncbi:hypothetical protein [Croceiramulus getboli]|nr:hypothetical protein P8624_11795 [Flavobacteriaceae bacterium YJPT1-3]